MVVGAALVEIHVHGSRSLKEKRGVVRSISRRVRNRFNLSVAEVGGQDTWQRAQLGLAAAGCDARSVRRLLERCVDFVCDLHLADVTGSEIQLVALEHEEPDDDLDGDEASQAFAHWAGSDAERGPEREPEE